MGRDAWGLSRGRQAEWVAPGVSACPSATGYTRDYRNLAGTWQGRSVYPEQMSLPPVLWWTFVCCTVLQQSGTVDLKRWKEMRWLSKFWRCPNRKNLWRGQYLTLSSEPPRRLNICCYSWYFVCSVYNFIMSWTSLILNVQERNVNIYLPLLYHQETAVCNYTERLEIEFHSNWS